MGQRLARTETATPPELTALRAPLVADFLAHARRNVPFYRDRLDLASPEAIGQAWSRIPILTRAEAARNRDRLMSENVPPSAGKVIEKETSGSTGMPLRYRSTMAFDAANCALTERMFRWWRVDGKKAFAQIARTTKETARARDGTVAQGWHTARPNGMKYSLAHIFDIDTQLRWLVARKPAYFSSFSGIIKELAVTAQRQSVKLKFDLVFSVAAIVDAETRDLCRSVFGAEIADTYGAQEAGHLAAQCPDCGQYHLSADATVVEILREDGSPADPGEIGRIVVTPLHNYAMPLIRYELGDFAEVGSAPQCQRTLPTIRRVLGRYRNLFRFRDGTRIWPVATGFFLGNFVAHKQFQIVQTDFDHIEIRYVPDGAPGPIDLPGLTQRVRYVLRQPVEVTVHAVDKIERAVTGKFEDCISLVPAA
jgi:phenylacetate-CoA ligase